MNRLSNRTKAAIIYEKGTPDVFKWEEVEIPNPTNKEVRLKNTAIMDKYNISLRLCLQL